MLILESKMITRLTEEITGLKTIGNPSVLAGLHDICMLLPACIVVPGGGEPAVKNKDALPQVEGQEWDTVILVAHQAYPNESGRTEEIAGAFMTAIYKALQGWKADPTQRQGFIYQGREAPIYTDGYAEFPMTFYADTVIGQ